MATEKFQVDSIDRDAIVNPRVIFEVLSQSTESYDRGKKFELYRHLDSLEEYVLVSQDEALIERFSRQEKWVLAPDGVQGIECRVRFTNCGNQPSFFGNLRRRQI